MNPAQRQRTLMILTAAVAGLYVANLVVIEPLMKVASDRNLRIRQLQKLVEEGRKLIVREPGLRSSWDRIRTNSLPANHSLAEQKLLGALDAWAKETGSEIADRVPQWKGDAEDHQTLNCRLEVTGSMSSLTQFLQKIEGGPMAMKLDSVQLTTRDPAGQQITLGLQVNALVLASTSKP